MFGRLQKVAWIVAFACLVSVFAIEVDRASHQSPPNNSEKPAKSETRNSPSSNTVGSPASKPHSNERQQEGYWYSIFSDHPTEWLLVLFNGILALYTRRLFQATSGLFGETAGLRQAADQQRADMLRSIEAAERSADIAKDALITTERAFVFLEDIDIEYSTQPRGSSSEFRFLTMKPRWRNNGNTPTKNMRVRVNWTPWQGDLADYFSYAYGAPAAPMFLGPKATEWSAAINVPSNVATDAFNERSRIFIWGRVDYEDIFDDTGPHFTQWCYRLVFVFPGGAFGNPIRTQLVAFGNYNSSDEDTRQNQRT